MELTEDENMQKHAEQCMHCTQKTLPSYEYKRTCIACGYNVMNELTKLQQKKVNFINGAKNAQHKKRRNCIDVYQVNQGDDFNEF